MAKDYGVLYEMPDNECYITVHNEKHGLIDLIVNPSVRCHSALGDIISFEYEKTGEHTRYKYLRNLSQEFNIDVETEPKFYDIELFGDHLHVNKKGAERFTESKMR